MSSVDQLMGVGETAEIAKRSGFFIQTIATAGNAIGPGNQIIRASGESLNLSGFSPGDILFITFVTAGTVYPGSNDQFGTVKTTASGLVCTANVTKTFIKFNQNLWYVGAGGLTA